MVDFCVALGRQTSPAESERPPTAPMVPLLPAGRTTACLPTFAEHQQFQEDGLRAAFLQDAGWPFHVPVGHLLIGISHLNRSRLVEGRRNYLHRHW